MSRSEEEHARAADGGFGSFIWCRHGLADLAKKMWGADMSVTEEDHGEREKMYEMRFLDAVETYDEVILGSSLKFYRGDTEKITF